MFALVDANNMYVSCERVFQPRLVGRPVVVLSANDGVCIARSNEAKALGVRMAQPWFEVRHLVRSAGLIALSANFELYSDLSARMMAIAARFAPEQMIYSIDESFLSFQGVPGDLLAVGRGLRAAVLRETGLPTSVGFGPTMTLAKLANHIAKSADRAPSDYPRGLAQVCHLGALDDAQLERLLASTPVGEVWGVGRKIDAQLRAGGVHSVLDLVRADPASLRQRFSVTLEKTLRELRGTACLSLDDAPATRQQILVSRSFGKGVSDRSSLEEAVSEFASRAAEKLRQQGSVAGSIIVFFMTSPFRRQDRPHQVNSTVRLARPSADTAQLVSAAVGVVRQEFRAGFHYVRAGVTLINLSPAEQQQGELDLFAPKPTLSASGTDRTREGLMETIDKLNRRFGRGSVQIGSASLVRGDQQPGWSARRESRSPRYTTCWEEMPLVRA